MRDVLIVIQCLGLSQETIVREVSVFFINRE